MVKAVSLIALLFVVTFLTRTEFARNEAVPNPGVSLETLSSTAPKEHPVLAKISIQESEAHQLREKQQKLKKRREFLMKNLNKVNQTEGELLIEKIEEIDDEILAVLASQSNLLKETANNEI